MAQITITVNEQELARARILAQAAGLSVEEWLRRLIAGDGAGQVALRPHDSLFGLFADDPEATSAIDAVVSERRYTRLRAP